VGRRAWSGGVAGGGFKIYVLEGDCGQKEKKGKMTWGKALWGEKAI